MNRAVTPSIVCVMFLLGFSEVNAGCAFFDTCLDDPNGTYTWDNGNKYVGEWKDGDMNGRGVFTWGKGGRYEGEFRNDKRHGHGVLHYANGASYDGQWREAKRHGRGVFINTDGGKYDGQWKENYYHGKGTYYYPSGSVHVGQYREGARNGKGKTTWKNGDVYIGPYTNNQRNGKGVFYYADGIKSEERVYKNNKVVKILSTSTSPIKHRSTSLAGNLSATSVSIKTTEWARKQARNRYHGSKDQQAYLDAQSVLAELESEIALVSGQDSVSASREGSFEEVMMVPLEKTSSFMGYKDYSLLNAAVGDRYKLHHNTFKHAANYDELDVYKMTYLLGDGKSFLTATMKEERLSLPLGWGMSYKADFILSHSEGDLSLDSLYSDKADQSYIDRKIASMDGSSDRQRAQNHERDAREREQQKKYDAQMSQMIQRNLNDFQRDATSAFQTTPATPSSSGGTTHRWTSTSTTSEGPGTPCSGPPPYPLACGSYKDSPDATVKWRKGETRREYDARYNAADAAWRTKHKLIGAEGYESPPSSSKPSKASAQ